MKCRLMLRRVEDPQPGISALLWSEDVDARLLEWKEFQGGAALGVWLAGLAVKYGRENFTLDWGDGLKTDLVLAPIVEKIFGELSS
jgi:hypothetical protein